MTSLLDVRLGSQEPVIAHRPPDVVSLAAADEAIELADAYGVCDGFPLSESQKITLRLAAGERADGSWAATRIGDFGPREGTGKNDKIAAWELAHLILFGTDLIIHTAHEFPTANESFLRLVAVFDAWDDLRKKVARIRYANGEQGIELLSGQRLKYRARTGGSGRGFAKAGLIVYDEAQHLSVEHVAASGPAKLANPNAQTWYAGSGGLSTSTVAWQIRRAAILGTGGRLAYTEMTGEQVSVVDGQIVTRAPDPTDRDVWYRCIPGLGRWVTEEAVEALFDELGPELFAREILCVWEPGFDDRAERVWGPGVFESVVAADVPMPEHGLVFTVAVNQERSASSIGWASAGGTCGLVQDSHGAARRPGVLWVVDELKRIAVPRKATVGCSSQDGSLLLALEQAGLKVHPITPAEQRAGCVWMYDAVIERKVVVHRHPDLVGAVASAVKKPSGDGFVWDRRAGDVSALVAVTDAAYLAQGRVEAKPVFAY